MRLSSGVYEPAYALENVSLLGKFFEIVELNIKSLVFGDGSTYILDANPIFVTGYIFSSLAICT
jgi:hypothetical protein